MHEITVEAEVNTFIKKKKNCLGKQTFIFHALTMLSFYSRLPFISILEESNKTP